MKKKILIILLFLLLIVGLYFQFQPYCEKVDILYSCINGQLDSSYYINDSQICTVATGVPKPKKIYRNICNTIGLMPFLIGLILIFSVGIFGFYKINKGIEK